MAEWQRNSLADTGAFQQLAEQGEAAITTVQNVLQIVQGGAEVAKLFLTGVANPAAKAAELLADAIIASLSNYKESGYFLLIINPFDDFVPHHALTLELRRVGGFEVAWWLVFVSVITE